jgi:hypothetical protein
MRLLSPPGLSGVNRVGVHALEHQLPDLCRAHPMDSRHAECLPGPVRSRSPGWNAVDHTKSKRVARVGKPVSDQA